MLKNISVSNNLKVSRKEYVTWKYAIPNLYSLSYIHYLLYQKKSSKETKPDPEKLPLETAAVPSLLWIAGRAGQALLRAPYQRYGRIKPKPAVVRPMGCHRNEHRVTRCRKIYGLDKDLVVHCPSMQKFGCNF